MFVNPRNLILAVLAAVFISAGLIFYAWKPVFKTESETTAPENAGKISFLPSDGAGSGVLWNLKMEGERIFSEVRRTPETSQQSGLLSPAQTGELAKLSPDELRKKYFSFLYPEVYLDYLRTNQDFMVSEGVLKPEEKVEFKNEDEVFSFLRKLGAYVYGKNVILSDPAKTFDAEIEILKKLHNAEAEALERGILRPAGPSSFIGKIKFSALRLLGIKTAYAAGECYRDAGPNPVVGANDSTICCDCGIQRIWKIPVPIPDAIGCKTFGGRCNLMNFGCLNGPGYGGNAIWDPVSKICGYDAGGGLGFFGIVSKILNIVSAISGISGLLGGGAPLETGGIFEGMPAGLELPSGVFEGLPGGFEPAPASPGGISI